MASKPKIRSPDGDCGKIQMMSWALYAELC